MKQVAQNYRSGELAVLDVPPPACAEGGVLVRSLYSLISTGTEMQKVGEAKLSLVGKARARPDQVRKVVDSVARQGPATTYKKVMNRLDSYTPLGYSLCGVVVDVGRGAEEFEVGQVVAAAGNEYALHAEYNWVPTNLCVPVPDGVRPEHAAFATVGAIAMHGVRRAEVQLGDSACVVGLGLVGQLVVRLLVAAGVRVVGLDTVDDRCRMAEKAGARVCAEPTAEGIGVAEQALRQMSGGLGADHVFLVAGGSSNGPVEAAARLARDRARVIDIGKCRLDLPWNSYYDKELDVRFSRSYGPGRYDDRYEKEGIDYPAGYVRWTERRNLACFIDLIAREELDVGALVSRTFPITEATDAYQELGAGASADVGFLFEYPTPNPTPTVESRTEPRTSVRRRSIETPRLDGRVRLGFVGAGNYASSMLLPCLAKNESVTLAHVATTRALSAATAGRRFGFETLSTDADAVLDDESIDAVFIVTRHSTHADLACRALQSGKAVFVEKPLCLTADELARIADVVEATGNDRLMVGFNRRFCPLLGDLRSRFRARGSAPAVVRYLVNAGNLESGSWYLDETAEGSRFAGEGGHFIDTVSWWVDSVPVEVHAVRGPEAGDVQCTLRYANGSVATVTYVTGGGRRFPKETLDAAAGGRSARFDNFASSRLWSDGRPVMRRARPGQDKGQSRELAQFVHAVRTGGPMPIRIESLVATTGATLAADRSIATGKTEGLAPGTPAGDRGSEP